MEYNQFSWERQQSLSAGAALSAADIETMTKLLVELREVTLSRKSYIAATEFLWRFGYEVDTTALVRPETASR